MPWFDDHLASARREPAYWSYLTSLEFIDAIVAEMDEQGVNGAELARRMGTSRAWVSRVLAGQCNLTMASMGKLAYALGMTVSTTLEPIAEAAADQACDDTSAQHQSSVEGRMTA